MYTHYTANNSNVLNVAKKTTRNKYHFSKMNNKIKQFVIDQINSQNVHCEYTIENWDQDDAFSTLLESSAQFHHFLKQIKEKAVAAAEKIKNSEKRKYALDLIKVEFDMWMIGKSDLTADVKVGIEDKIKASVAAYYKW